MAAKKKKTEKKEAEASVKVEPVEKVDVVEELELDGDDDSSDDVVLDDDSDDHDEAVLPAKTKGDVPESDDKSEDDSDDEEKGLTPEMQQAIIRRAEEQIAAIIKKGKKNGYLTYEQMNDELPDEAISPNRLDSLLMTLDEMGIQILDEADVEKLNQDDFDGTEGKAKTDAKGDQVLERTLGQGDGKRIDDPVRMYLTQMGEIPLLSREEEISLAKKIELTRLAFRRKVLENDYCAYQAIEILQQVQDGALPFDRTMKMSTAENLIRAVVKNRLPQNIGTVTKLLACNA